MSQIEITNSSSHISFAGAVTGEPCTLRHGQLMQGKGLNLHVSRRLCCSSAFPSALVLHRLQTGAPAPLIADDVNDIIQRNAAKLDDAIDYQRDFE